MQAAVSFSSMLNSGIIRIPRRCHSRRQDLWQPTTNIDDLVEDMPLPQPRASFKEGRRQRPRHRLTRTTLFALTLSQGRVRERVVVNGKCRTRGFLRSKFINPRQRSLLPQTPRILRNQGQIWSKRKEQTVNLREPPLN